MIDTLTSVYKKQYLEEFFNRHSIDDYQAMLIDIDEFKEVNKKFGYHAGDMVIKQFTEVLLSLLPSTAVIVRVGGTEFLVLSPKEKGTVEVQAQKVFDGLKEKKYF